jgi:uncharacterized protein YbjQ (UPF0145 family)
MAEECANCGEEITAGGIIKASNHRYPQRSVDFVNFVTGSTFEELCAKCGILPVSEANGKVHGEIQECRQYVEGHISDFPMLTVQYLPPAIGYRIKGMLTANVTVGTGFFSEFSQGTSDFFGAVTTQSGMAHKVNKGEGTARAILVNKAIAAGANCIIGVDIDYGVTANNAATVNMQGTAILVDDLKALLDRPEYEKAQEIMRKFDRVLRLNRWLAGKLESEAGAVVPS